MYDNGITSKNFNKRSIIFSEVLASGKWNVFPLKSKYMFFNFFCKRKMILKSAF